jgi:hypothetical protein
VVPRHVVGLQGHLWSVAAETAPGGRIRFAESAYYQRSCSSFRPSVLVDKADRFEDFCLGSLLISWSLVMASGGSVAA